MTETTPNTQVLVDRAGQGDDTARRELLERFRGYLSRMVAAARSPPGARVDPSDIVQETLADAALRMDDTCRDRPLPFIGWLRHLAKSTRHRRTSAAYCFTAAKHRAEMPPPELSDASAGLLVRKLLAHDTSPSNRMMRQERGDQVRAALAALPPRNREVLVMRHLEQLSTAEIAEALGISRGPSSPVSSGR